MNHKEKEMQMNSIARMGSRNRIQAAFLAGTVILAMMGLADEDPYAGYVKLTRKDTSSNSSWNAAGGWSDGLAPGITNDYYVAPGALLWRIQDKTDAGRTWNGGQLAIAGVFHVGVSEGDKYAPTIPDLVLLGGGELRAECYGPLYPVNDVTSTVTVAGTAENPSKLTQHYPSSFTSSGNARSHLLRARFIGTAQSVLQFMRPFRNYQPANIDRGFYCRGEKITFADYPGTFWVTGGNTIFKSESSITFNWPQTALKVDDSAECFLYNNNTFLQATSNAFLRALEVTGGGRLGFNYNDAYKCVYPVVNLSDRLVLGSGIELLFNTSTLSTFIGGLSETNPDGFAQRLFRLTGTAAETVGDISGVTMKRSDGLVVPDDFELRVVANGDGSKDVCVFSPNVVAMTNANVETTGYAAGSNPAGTPQYGAFEPGHAGDWTNGETPTADSTNSYWNTARLCFFQPVYLPNAKLSFGANSSWKEGESLTFKEINFFAGTGFGLWGGDPKRTITAERVNLHRNTSGSYVSIYCGQAKHLTIDADLCGDGSLNSYNMNNQIGGLSLSHANTNFHGRLRFTQQAQDGVLTPRQFTTYLGDARNWGGEYTGSTDTHDAIILASFMKVAVTNDVDFTEPTRGITVQGGAAFEVQAGRTMRLSNQVTYAGVVEKMGPGTLDLAGTARFIDGAAGTAPVAETNVLNVLAGALKISSKTAADGLAVSFAEGTRLIIPSGSEAGYHNVKWSAPLSINTNSGTLPVEIDMTGAEGVGDMEVPICTFSAAAAVSIPATAFDVARASNGFRCKSVAKRANGDGSVSYVATLGFIGAQLIVR